MDLKRYINTRIWSDTWFENLDSTERLVWLYLLTNQQTNLIGIYEIGLKRISNDSGVEINRLQTVMERFANDSKAFHNGKYVVIPNYLRNQTLANPNMEKSARNLFDSLPEEVKNLLKSIGIEDFQKLKKGFPNGYQTVCKPFINRSIREKEREKEIEREEERESKGKTKNDEITPVISAALMEEDFIEESESQQLENFPEQQNGNQIQISATNQVVYESKAKRMTQLEMMQFITLPHDTPEFRKAWIDWLSYKTLIRDPYKAPATMQAALKKFANHPPEVGIAAIHDSISNQWKGVFPEKSKYNAGNQQSSNQSSIGQGSVSRIYQKLVASRGAG